MKIGLRAPGGLNEAATSYRDREVCGFPAWNIWLLIYLVFFETGLFCGALPILELTL